MKYLVSALVAVCFATTAFAAEKSHIERIMESVTEGQKADCTSIRPFMYGTLNGREEHLTQGCRLVIDIAKLEFVKVTLLKYEADKKPSGVILEHFISSADAKKLGSIIYVDLGADGNVDAFFSTGDLNLDKFFGNFESEETIDVAQKDFEKVVARIVKKLPTGI